MRRECVDFDCCVSHTACHICTSGRQRRPRTSNVDLFVYCIQLGMCRCEAWRLSIKCPYLSGHVFLIVSHRIGEKRDVVASGHFRYFNFYCYLLSDPASVIGPCDAYFQFSCILFLETQKKFLCNVFGKSYWTVSIYKNIYFATFSFIPLSALLSESSHRLVFLCIDI